jgi:hypothetical protein
MAWNPKYRIETNSKTFADARVDIEFEDYAGAVIELKAAYNDAIRYSANGDSANPTDPIMPSEMEVTFFVESNFRTIDIAQKNEREVRLSYYVGGVLKWRGWVNPTLYSENYHKPPYSVTVTAECGLDQLAKVPFEFEVGETPATMWTILREALFTEIALPFKESINIYDDEMNNGNADSPLLQGIIYYESFGTEPSCQDVLRAILEPFKARIVLKEGYWHIENIAQKTASYIVREYNSAGVYQSNSSFNPLVELSLDAANFRQVLNKSGRLSYYPPISTAQVTYQAKAGSTVLRGFQDPSDWVNSTTLKDWTANGLSLVQEVPNFDNNKLALALFGRDTSYNPDANYIESDGVAVGTDRDIQIDFAFFANWPSIVLFGSKPSFWVQLILEGDDTNTYYYNKNRTWQESKTAIDITPGTRKKWYKQQLVLTNLPSSGTLKIRFSRLIKTGSDTNTFLLLTGFSTNLASEDIDLSVWNLDTARTDAFSTYERVTFEHFITDLPNDGEVGGITVGGVPTSNWNRRGKTDNLNLRVLFLKQYLGLHARATGSLGVDIIIRNGLQISALNTVKDTVSASIYFFTSYSLDYQSGVITCTLNELLADDATLAEVIEGVRVNKPFVNFRSITNPETEQGGTNDQIAGSDLNLLGDTAGDPNANILVASAIQNKPVADFTMPPVSSALELNIVSNTLGSELTKTTPKALFNAWEVKTTPIATDKIVIIDSADSDELKVVTGVPLTMLGQGGATTGQAVVWDGAKWAAGTISGSRWTPGTGDDIFRSLGNVGIGVNPTAKFHVRLNSDQWDFIVRPATVQGSPISGSTEIALGKTGTSSWLRIANNTAAGAFPVIQTNSGSFAFFFSDSSDNSLLLQATRVTLQGGFYGSNATDQRLILNAGTGRYRFERNNAGGVPFEIDASVANNLDLSIRDLPTSDPLIANRVWNNGGVLTLSAG